MIHILVCVLSADLACLSYLLEMFLYLLIIEDNANLPLLIVDVINLLYMIQKNSYVGRNGK